MIKTFHEYQVVSGMSDLHIKEPNVSNYLLGLTSEIGELSQKFYKFNRDGNIASDELFRLATLELGDILWYVTRIANHMGYSLEEVANFNAQKLDSRLKRGVIKGSGDER